jgi:serine/threonine-protein kinase HipA
LGAVPTTHILKPAVVGFVDHDLNEHLCLRAARLTGLLAARSRVVSFGVERAIVVERYDRASLADGTIVRIHQEDMCQALGTPPTAKYQSEGGPGPEQIIELLNREIHPTARVKDEVGRFVDALAFNWIIAGTDAHAKNYSVLLASGQVRFAPIYDIASALPYDDMYLPRLRLAMRIGGEYGIERIGGRHWHRFAVANGLDPDDTLTRLDQLAARVPASFAQAAQDDAVQALGSALPAVLVERVSARVERCRADLAQQ